jgi:hypothetical protein
MRKEEKEKRENKKKGENEQHPSLPKSPPDRK